MKEIACPHCTFLNAANKVKCGVCLRLLRKRDRSVHKDGASSSEAPTASTSPQPSDNAHASDASPQAAQDSDVTPARPLATPPALPPPAPASAAPPLVATLFATASGKPVTVRRESLHKAAERLGDTVGPDGTERVPTLFETASGKAVTVQRQSLEKARTALSGAEDGEDVPPPSSSSVPTLFATASGTAVRVSRAALQHAAERLQETRSPEDPADPPATPAEGPRTAPAAASPAATDCAAAAPLPATATTSLGLGVRRRGFVPPQRRLSTPAAALKPPPSAAPSPAPSTSLPPLRLSTDACTSRGVSPVPPLASLATLAFAFTATDCGSSLAALLGVRGADAVELHDWHGALLKLGASAKHCTLEWCRHAVASAMVRARFMASAAAGNPNPVFSAATVLLCVMQLYNTEVVDGERPALRKVAEGDISSASLMVLYLSSVCEERSAPHMRIVTLCDGVYHLRATCDVPLSNLIREGVLQPGQKIAVCGAKSLLHGQCTPTECTGQVALSINYNCVHAVAVHTPLGVCHGEPLPLPLSLVHPLGGLVPAIEGVVARVLPTFFIAQAVDEAPASADGTRPARDRSIKTVRNLHSQLQVSDRLQREAEAAAEGAVPAEARPLSRVTSLLIVKDGAEALVQQWETVEERGAVTDEDGGTSLPAEGSWVTLYAVNPAKSRTAAAPFSRAKLFFSARKLHYVPSRRPLQHMRHIWRAAADHDGSVGVGGAVDVCGLYVGSHRSQHGTFAMVLMEGDTYALLQLPVLSAGRSLTLPLPTAERVPLAVMNATFLTAEDAVAGSDCCRLFANEYTTVTQRSTQANVKEALAAAVSLRALIEAAPHRYAARRSEIARCLDEGVPTAGASTGGGTAAAPGCDAPSAPEMPTDAARDAPLAVASAASAVTGTGFGTAAAPAQREGRVPYYLRQGSGGAGPTRLQGVQLPPSPHAAAGTGAGRPLVQPSSPPTCVPPALAHAPPAARRDHYGNVADLVFLADPRLNRRGWHPLGEALLGATHPGEGFARVQLCLRLSANSDDDVTCRVEERATLGALLESVCPLQELCSVIADERHIDVSLVRSERVSRWRRQAAATLWWRFFADSRELAAAADLECAPEQYLWWLPGEWAEAMRTVAAKLQGAFFFFSINNGALRRVRLIAESCDVAELPWE